MRRLLKFLVAVFMTSAATLVHAENLPESDRFAGHEKLVAETHAASLKLREASLRETIARKEAWPPGTWGDNLWCLAALYLNEKTDEANARLLKRAKDFIASKPENLREDIARGSRQAAMDLLLHHRLPAHPLSVPREKPAFPRASETGDRGGDEGIPLALGPRGKPPRRGRPGRPIPAARHRKPRSQPPPALLSDHRVPERRSRLSRPQTQRRP